nr:YidC/Oxa1 family membrane protein insertase [Clostridiales bacterium]
MTVFEMLHKLILGPIELLFDVIFALSMQMTKSPVLSIVVLSLAINLLVLPLYKKADAMQREEQEISKRLKPRIDQIREVFTGDERFMMLQTYYRQNHYKPYYVLRGSLSLLLQIPFFMAAYNFLTGLGVLQVVVFGPIADLAAPDGILKLGG